MSGSINKNNVISEDLNTMNNSGMIDEYKSLRDEIISRQDARTNILGFTITGIGVTIGLVISAIDLKTGGINYFAFALISFALLIIIAALILTIQHTQQIDTISGYIKKFIEPNIYGIKWESYYGKYRNLRKRNPKSGGMPLGTSKPLAIFYCILALATCLLLLPVGLLHYWYATTFIVLLTIVSLSFSFNLYLRKTKGWHFNWNELDEQNNVVTGVGKNDKG
jgi:hypothetical protein